MMLVQLISAVCEVLIFLKGALRISSDRDDQIGRKIKTKKIVLNTLNKSLLKSSYPKTTCQIFLPKKLPELKISHTQKSFNHPSHLKPRVPPMWQSIVFSFVEVVNKSAVRYKIVDL